MMLLFISFPPHKDSCSRAGRPRGTTSSYRVAGLEITRPPGCYFSLSEEFTKQEETKRLRSERGSVCEAMIRCPIAYSAVGGSRRKKLMMERRNCCCMASFARKHVALAACAGSGALVSTLLYIG